MKSNINVVCNLRSQEEKKKERKFERGKEEVPSMNRFVNRLEGIST